MNDFIFLIMAVYYNACAWLTMQCVVGYMLSSSCWIWLVLFLKPTFTAVSSLLLTVMTHDEALQELIILRQQVAELRSATSTDSRGSLLSGLPSLSPSIQFAGSECLQTMSLPELSEAFELSENLVSILHAKRTRFYSLFGSDYIVHSSLSLQIESAVRSLQLI